MSLKFPSLFIFTALICVVTKIVWAHVPVPLDKVPDVVIESVKERSPGIIISEAAVDVGHSEVLVEAFIITYVIKAKSAAGEDVVVEVTDQGLIIQIYDRDYYEEYIED